MIERNEKYEEEIFNIVKANPQRYGRMLRAKGSKNHKNPNREHLLKYIYERTSFLDGIKDAILPIRLLYLRSNVSDLPVCVIDGKPIEKFNVRYFPGIFGNIEEFLSKQTCCRDCAFKLAQRSREEYFQKNFGNEITNTFQLEKTKEKIRETKIKEHGDPKYCNRNKIKETNLEKYGKAFYFQTDEFQEKSKKTKIARFGVDHQIRSQAVKDGMAERYLKKHGVPYSTQDPEVISKMHWKYFYDGKKFDSAWEIAYYRHLKESGVNFQYQPDISIKYVSDGKIRHYRPDFLINGIIYEVKGDNLIKYYGDNSRIFNRPDYRAMQAKMQKCFELEKEGKLKFVLWNDLKTICDYISETEGMSFKRWSRQFKVSKRSKTLAN